VKIIGEISLTMLACLALSIGEDGQSGDPSERMGKIIDRLAAEMLTPGIDASWPSKLLLSIDDERVVPYFVKALETRSYSRKFDAICALAKYLIDEAVAALEKALSTTGLPRH
jgi:hypothetical protein